MTPWRELGVDEVATGHFRGCGGRGGASRQAVHAWPVDTLIDANFTVLVR